MLALESVDQVKKIHLCQCGQTLYNPRGLKQKKKKAEEERILSATHLELRGGSVSSGPQTGTHSVSQHSWFSGRRTWSGMLPPTFMTLQHAEDRLLDLSASAIT